MRGLRQYSGLCNASYSRFYSGGPMQKLQRSETLMRQVDDVEIKGKDVLMVGIAGPSGGGK